jgi:hypothetical protein
MMHQLSVCMASNDSNNNIESPMLSVILVLLHYINVAILESDLDIEPMAMLCIVLSVTTCHELRIQ